MAIICADLPIVCRVGDFCPDVQGSVSALLLQAENTPRTPTERFAIKYLGSEYAIRLNILEYSVVKC